MLRGGGCVSAGTPVFSATERNPQSNGKVLGREWGVSCRVVGRNLERSGKPEHIPAGGDPLQMHICGEAPSAEARDCPRLERGFGGRQTCASAPRGRGVPRVSAAAPRGCARRLPVSARFGTARLGTAAAVLAWQRGSARVIYSSQRSYNGISRLASADGIFFFFSPVSQACLPQNTWPPFFLPACHIAIVLIAAEW